ncbi:MAG: hypothetical protein KKD05_08400 [Candidatus Omnitrophica bacterium]|nr:hypothetical protein [Candidatus Omnitrophota bacterium]
MISKKRNIICPIIAAFILISTTTSADTWKVPKSENYFSKNLKFRFRVIPLSSKGKDLSDKSTMEFSKCTGIMEIQNEKGEYNLIWKQTLSNDVTPVSGLVTNNGEYVVTFDNHHSMGYGNNVVVIYGPDGSIIRQLALKDFLSDNEIAQLPHTISSIWWHDNKHHFDQDEKLLILVIRLASDVPKVEEKNVQYKEIHIRLVTGEVIKK